MKKLLVLLCSVCSFGVFAYPPSFDEYEIGCCENWYGVVGAGYAFSFEAGIDNPDPASWDFANQGYDDDLGGSPFFMIGFGRTFCCLNFDVTYSYYQTFHYQKYQTGAGATPGFSGNARTRYFDLDHQNVIFDLTLDPVWDCVNWRFCSLNLRPIIGVGIGLGVNRITNFHTVGFDAVANVGSTTTIGEPHTKTTFAWRALAALRIGLNSCLPLTLDIGYRYYDGGYFEGPSSFVVNTDGVDGGILSAAPWEGNLKTNEVYLCLNYGF